MFVYTEKHPRGRNISFAAKEGVYDLDLFADEMAKICLWSAILLGICWIGKAPFWLYVASILTPVGFYLKVNVNFWPYNCEFVGREHLTKVLRAEQATSPATPLSDT